MVGIEDFYDADDDGDEFSDTAEIAYGSNLQEMQTPWPTPPVKS